MTEFVDLTPVDGGLLRRFYAELYVGEFPDPNERESLENMLAYLARGNGDGNRYLVTLALDEGAIVAGCVADYFARSSCGAIEFLVVAETHRGTGLGSRLAARIEERMGRSARERSLELALVCAEINDPFKRSDTPDNLDPFRRLGFWAGLGYRRIAFPYRQPALSPGQAPVENLLLAGKPVTAGLAGHVPSTLVEQFVCDYLEFAMRIDEPKSQREFAAMAKFLEARERVELEDLNVYIGDDRAHPLEARAVRTGGDADFEPAMAVYRRAFVRPALAIPVAEFAARLQERVAGGAYHLWTLRAGAEAAVHGMASFFSLPAAGFGGYLALEEPLRGRGRLRGLLARIERALVGDSSTTRGWYIECEDDVVPIFERCGFSRLALPYRQPGLANGAPAVALSLLYKEFGASYAPQVRKREFVAAMGDIASVIYRLDQAAAERWIAGLCGPIAGLASDEFLALAPQSARAPVGTAHDSELLGRTTGSAPGRRSE